MTDNALIIKLRNLTGCGIMDCKQALIERNKDLELLDEVISVQRDFIYRGGYLEIVDIYLEERIDKLYDKIIKRLEEIIKKEEKA